MTETRTIQRYGWKPSLPDQRDLHADTAELKVMPEVDPRRDMVAPYDQGNLGSCTANAVAGAIQYDRSLNHDSSDDYTPSRLDIYYGERQLEGAPIDQDTGAFGRDGLKYAHSQGVFDERLWPYDISKFAESPPSEARQKIGSYKVVPRNITAFKRVLSNRQTVCIGFTVYESFESSQVAQTGVMPLPSEQESVLGGHEVLVVGYLKSEPHYALVRNSWGGWGLGGYFLMPWAVLTDPGMSDDFRTIYRPKGK